jgi:starch-binding outer membrane protein, SusD/RagB family
MRTFPYILLFLIGLSAFSCNFLDESSPNDIAADGAITDGASAEAALGGIYSSMQSNSYYGFQYMLIGDALADNASTGGYQALSLDQIGAKELTSANIITEGMWVAVYRVIANANYLIEALPKVTDLEPKEKNHLEGQARALRALAHFDLLRLFGEHYKLNSSFGVPIIKTVQTINDKPGRASVSAVYDFVIEELNKVTTQLDPSQTQVQYLNIQGVNALLARVYLYKKDLAKAAEFADKVIKSNAFKLLPAAEYESIFTGRRTSESVFELAFDSQNRSGFNGGTYSRDDAIRPELDYMATKNLQDFFATRPGDVRLKLLDYDPANNDATIVPDGRTQKYRGEESKDNPAYIIRYAEVLLIMAEARGGQLGLTFLNQLTQARGNRAYDASVGNNAAQFTNAILDERRAEFNFEGQRMFDLARTGSVKRVLGVDDFRGILPIPIREITASGDAIVQNPGYE